MQGEITAVSDGQTVNFSTAKNAAAETLANAGAGQNANQTGDASATASGSAGVGQNTAGDGAAGGAALASANAGGGNAGGAAGATATAGNYVLNTNSHKFHLPDCPSVESISPKNRKDVNESREQIISEGYTPCKRCNP